MKTSCGTHGFFGKQRLISRVSPSLGGPVCPGTRGLSVLALEVLHSGSPLSAGPTGTVGHPISWDSPSASSLNPVSISLYCLNHGGPPPPIQLLRADSRDLNSDNWAEVSPIQGAGGMASLSPTCSTTIKTALLSACNGAADGDLEAAPACLQPRPPIRCCIFASPLL